MRYSIIAAVTCFGAFALSACEEAEPDVVYTMCYSITPRAGGGRDITINCESTTDCSFSARTPNGEYPSWDLCWDDTDFVVDEFERSGRVVRGPNASGGGGSSGVCNDDYVAAHPNIQIDAPCQAAYAVLCNGGNPDVVREYCINFEALVDAYWDGTGSRPSCTYCD